MRRMIYLPQNLETCGLKSDVSECLGKLYVYQRDLNDQCPILLHQV